VSQPAPHLRGLLPEELAERFSLPMPLARRVTTRLLWRGSDSLDDIPGLSRERRAALLAGGRLDRLAVVDRRLSRLDPFAKYLFQAPDGRRLEAVRIPLERPRFSVCVSSQVGCALDCAFCETGRMGFARNLETWEILDQVLAIRREARERPVTGVVFQGQGEPLLNYDNVLRAAALLRHPCGLRIRGDRITLSTVGILPMIERYTEEGHPYRLLLSLASAFDERRAGLVPIARRYPVEALAAAVTRLARARGGLVHVGWVLISGVNTGPEEARELARLFAGVPLRVSVIDLNDPSGHFRAAGDEERGGFLQALADNGVAFVRRYSGGSDIHAACGMLASLARGGTELSIPPA
jgi:23S rRNA (adenine2503-C2)-methyltransferase